MIEYQGPAVSASSFWCLLIEAIEPEFINMCVDPIQIKED